MANGRIPILDTERLTLTLAAPSAAERVARYFRDNTAHHGPFNPGRPTEMQTARFWADRLQTYREEFQNDRSARFFLFGRGAPDGPVIGGCNLSEIVRGPFQACYLGFSLDLGAVGNGLMFEGASRVLAYAFNELALHRVMATHQPSNERSSRLLQRLGFVVEGFAKDYLHVNGAWRDHVLTALTNPVPQPPPQL